MQPNQQLRYGKRVFCYGLLLLGWTCACQATEPDADSVKPPELPAPKSGKKMPGKGQVWIDSKQGVVLIDGYVSLRKGYLEMFACPAGMKEHESVVAVLCRAQTAHAALLALGAKPGSPVKFHPKYEPPTGTEIAIEICWLDAKDKWKSCRAQEWITNVRTKKPMAAHWVFAGSGFWKDEQTGKQHYMAEGGDFICVSNFSTATLDIPVESSESNEGLLFQANTEKIPPLGTPIRLVLKPKEEKKKPPNRAQAQGLQPLNVEAVATHTWL